MPKVPQNNLNRRRFSKAFKMQVVREAQAGELSISQISRQHDLNNNQIFRWLREVKQGQAAWVRHCYDQPNLPSSDSVFIPVAIANKPEAQTVRQSKLPIVTIELAGGHRVILHEMNVNMLRTLLACLP
ncbi:MAG: transposase [Hahellaceae bacterium]|nr:transposase [Hahellaceae bacterium]MCP5209283.1 transposase [Hahellaceae bacterium]MCP5212244.1 transposase [Hahellaceae bacterium]